MSKKISELTSLTKVSDTNLIPIVDGNETKKVDVETLRSHINSDNYSLDEQVVGTWIDGKTIYRKTIACGNLPNNTRKSVGHGVTNMDRCISLTGYAYANGNSLPLPYVNVDSLTTSIQLYADRNSIYIKTGFDFSSYVTYVTLDYIKLSD